MKTENKISVFRNYFDCDPVGEISIKTFCEIIKGENKFIKKIEAIRNPLTSKDDRDNLKATLPCFTPSGTFSWRADENLIQHSGLACIDIDAGRNPNIKDWGYLRDDIIKINNIFFTALSVSGQGIFCFIPIAFPDKHKAQMRELLTAFAKVTGVFPDGSCINISRLRGISHDPQAKMNERAVRFFGVYQEPKQQVTRSNKKSSSNPIETARRMIREAVEGVRHETILRASILLGGYIAAGLLSESEAVAILRAEAESKLPSIRHKGAYKTIQNGIDHGKQKPIEK